MSAKANNLYASWELVPTCNLACSFCYSLNEEIDHEFKLLPNIIAAHGKKSENRFEVPSLKLIKRGLNNLSRGGIKYLNIEGGEPTLRGDLVSIVSAVKESGISPLLSTHGMYLLKTERTGLKLAESLLGKLDTLAISLDAPIAKINNAMRVTASGQPSHHFEKVLEFLQWYSSQCAKDDVERNGLYKLKINTVVTKENLDVVIQMGDFLKDLIPHSARAQLKFIQVHPRGKGRFNKKSLFVEDSIFDKLARQLVDRYNHHFDVSIRRYSEQVYPFLVIGNNGDIVVPHGESQSPLKLNSNDGSCVIWNVLQDDFCKTLERYLLENHEFIAANYQINTYK